MVSNKVWREDLQVKHEKGDEMKQVKRFNFLLSPLMEARGCEVRVEQRIKARLKKKNKRQEVAVMYAKNNAKKTESEHRQDSHGNCDGIWG